eukprot:m.192961 g.192961  ORF g.192961 m.192961 type:complete len:72 (+) comp39475_c0_seq2:382-597(+)
MLNEKREIVNTSDSHGNLSLHKFATPSRQFFRELAAVCPTQIVRGLTDCQLAASVNNSLITRYEYVISESP